MIQGFLTYDLAISLHERCERIQAKRYIRDQLLRASLSIVLNIAEGSGKPTIRDRRKFYAIALGSNHEVQALLMVLKQKELLREADRIGGLLYRLVHPKT